MTGSHTPARIALREAHAARAVARTRRQAAADALSRADDMLTDLATDLQRHAGTGEAAEAQRADEIAAAIKRGGKPNVSLSPRLRRRLATHKQISPRDKAWRRPRPPHPARVPNWPPPSSRARRCRARRPGHRLGRNRCRSGPDTRPRLSNGYKRRCSLHSTPLSLSKPSAFICHRARHCPPGPLLFGSLCSTARRSLQPSTRCDR